MHLYDIECEECGSVLLLDEELTIDFYYADEPFKVKEDGEIIEDTINKYLVYRCMGCEKYFKYTYQDWERLFRIKLSTLVTEVKKSAAFKNLDPESIREDGGLEFCGICEGYDNAGNCLKDIIEHCEIRLKHN